MITAAMNVNRCFLHTVRNRNANDTTNAVAQLLAPESRVKHKAMKQ